MSYEGYTEFLCEKGHRFDCDSLDKLERDYVAITELNPSGYYGKVLVDLT